MNEPGSRLADFDRRTAHSPAAVLNHRERGWRYITVHPFADDHAVLAAIGCRPEECRSVDAYWEIDHDVHLLQVWTVDDWPGPLGVFHRWDGGGYAANLVARLKPGPITRARFEAVMNHVAALLPLSGRPTKLMQLTAEASESW